ncbi:MAG: CPBP family intramembrane glutamic endopeptidase [Acidobacteriaceae bacterium]
MHEAPLQPAPAPAPLRPATSAVAPWWHTALLIVLLVAGSFASAFHSRHADLAAHRSLRYAIGIGTEWCMFLVAWWGLRFRRISVARILGFRRGARAWAEDIAAAGIFWIVSITILAVIRLILVLCHANLGAKTVLALAPHSAVELLVWIGLALSAGFCEEFVFRGYFLRQFSSPLHAVWLGVLVSSLLFGIAHGYQGIGGMLSIAVYGAIFCVLALLRSSLRPGMIAHAWQDIFTGVVVLLASHLHLP